MHTRVFFDGIQKESQPSWTSQDLKEEPNQTKASIGGHRANPT